MRHAKWIRGDSLCTMLKALGGLFMRPAKSIRRGLFMRHAKSIRSGLFMRHAKSIRRGLYMRHAESIRGDSLCAMLKALGGTLYAPC